MSYVLPLVLQRPFQYFQYSCYTVPSTCFDYGGVLHTIVPQVQVIRHPSSIRKKMEPVAILNLATAATWYQVLVPYQVWTYSKHGGIAFAVRIYLVRRTLYSEIMDDLVHLSRDFRGGLYT